MSAADVAGLQAIRSNLIQTLANETAAQLTGGAKPTYTLDGEVYNWSEWREKMTALIDSYTSQIQRMSGPYTVISRLKP